MKGSAQEVEKRAREGDRPNRSTMGRQQKSLVVTARETPLIRVQRRCVAMDKWGLDFTSF